ncbi:phosphate regulon sensor protein phor (sphs) [hydrocarbon metagenome]|uniref:histidine kinase n=1 Tax=hydrocarbon metagenome TaxID=938273 RepID=A0A0W8E230_9ZZZZ
MILENDHQIYDNWIMQVILSTMVEGVMVIDKNSYVIRVNRSAENIFMQRQNVLLYRKLQDITVNQDLINLVNAVLTKGKEIFQEITMISTRQLYRVHGAPIKDSYGLVQGAVVIFYDVTEVRDFAQVRSEFVGNVSHELRTPLTSIKGFVETLLDGAMENSAICRRFLTIIDAESDRLSRLIDDLLTLSSLESNEKISRLKPVCIAQSMRNVMNILGPQISEKQLQVEFIYSRSLPYIKADEDMLGQVLINLLDNAIKYTPRNGKIIIRSRRKDSRVITTFTDTGMGIPQESLSRVFERFYRVDKARSRRHGGTGLGLSIVKHIVESHGGEVFVNSEVGKGSTFGVGFLVI